MKWLLLYQNIYKKSFVWYLFINVNIGFKSIIALPHKYILLSNCKKYSQFISNLNIEIPVSFQKSEPRCNYKSNILMRSNYLMLLLSRNFMI